MITINKKIELNPIIFKSRKPLTIIFCIPGRTFSNKFLVSWTNLLMHCQKKGYNIYLSNKYSPNIYHSRSSCLGADLLNGKNQKPFNGDEYDYLMWIDSDVVFTPNDFEKLLSHDKQIVAGQYLMDGGKYFATVKDWDESFFKQNGHFKFLTKEDVKNERTRHRLLKVSYTGFGFMLIKKGVFEQFNYPFFYPKWTTFSSNIQDFSTEDVQFCRDANEKNIPVYVDLDCFVGHEKNYVYYPTI